MCYRYASDNCIVVKLYAVIVHTMYQSTFVFHTVKVDTEIKSENNIVFDSIVYIHKLLTFIWLSKSKETSVMLGYYTDNFYVALALAAALAFAHAISGLHWFISTLFIVINVLTLALYIHDKWCSQEPQQWRISEGHLLSLGLIGGWIGAIIAQQLFRHKTRKLQFQISFLCTIVLNTLIIYVKRDYIFS